MERVENLVDNVAIGVSLISPKMEILWLNKTLKEWFPSIDVSKKPFCYRSFYSPPKEEICDYCPAIKAFEDGEVRSSETSVCADGNFYLVTAAPLKNEKGDITTVIETVQNITERKKAEDRLVRLNKTFLGLGPDFDKNINLLTKACGELLGATCALYNRLEGGLLCSVGQWQVPKDYNPTDKPEGHICYDVIKRGREGGTYIVKNLPKTPYFKTDPNVARYGLITYVGYPVSCLGKPVGSLCVVYQKDVKFDENDKRILEIITTAIGVEEDRKRAEEALQQRIGELERMHRAFVGRELKMKELKEETKKLKEKLGER